MSWSRFWFEPLDRRALVMCRAIFAGVAFLHYLPVDFSGWADVADVFWSPGVLLAHLPAPSLPRCTLQLVQTLWKLSLLLAAVGIFTRPALIASVVGGFHLLTLRNGFVGFLHHEDGVALFVLAIFAAARTGDGASSGEYRWPLRLIQCLLALVFLGAALSKLRHSGTAWPSETFPSVVMMGFYDLIYARPLVRAGALLYEWSTVATAVGWAVLGVELAYGLSLFSRACRVVLVPAAVCMLIAIRVLMGPCFLLLAAAHVVWLPWSRSRAASSPWSTPRGDGHDAHAAEPEPTANVESIFVVRTRRPIPGTTTGS